MRRLSWIAGVVLTIPACVDENAVTPGQVGGPCLQGACFGDLACEAGICVDPGGASTGDGSDTTGGSMGEGSASPQTSGAPGSSGPTSPTSAETSSTPDDSTSDDDPSGRITGGPESETTAVTSPTTGPDESSGSSGAESESGAADVCAAERGDDECIECTKVECCDEVEACAADDGPGGCACAHDCVIGGGDLTTCVVGCGLYPFPEGSPIVPLANCMLEQCPSCAP
jgi:hypothetical protein